MAERKVSVSRVVPAPPEEIFDLLADPRRHGEIDGSGSVQGVLPDTPERLSLGAKFGMQMKVGLPYKIKNEVVEFDEGRRLAWRHFGHHVWRYELEPVEGGTEVTETFDWGPSRAPRFYELMSYPEKNKKSMEATLDRLAARFEAPATS